MLTPTPAEVGQFELEQWPGGSILSRKVSPSGLPMLPAILASNELGATPMEQL